jgi:hypothetical protein
VQVEHVPPPEEPTAKWVPVSGQLRQIAKHSYFDEYPELRNLMNHHVAAMEKDKL